MIPRFRAYDTQQKKMWSAEEMGRDELTINPDGRGFVNVSSTSPKLSQYFPHLIPLLYTGLEDHNKLEVCEGDVLHDLLHTEQYFVVEWQDGGFRLKLLIPHLRTGGSEDIDTVGEMEIIREPLVTLGKIKKMRDILTFALARR